MRAWDYHSRVVRERQAREAVESARAETASATAADADQFALMLTALDADCRQLSTLPQGSARTERKRGLIRTWLPVVETYLKSGAKYKNVILTQTMIWLFDVGEIDNAMRLARVAVAQNQPMPARFKRDIRTGVADLLLDWVNTRNGQQIEPYFSEIFEAVIPPDDAPGWAIHEEIKLKYIRVAIREAERNNPVRALELCKLAERIAPGRAKVKTKRAELEKKLKAQR